jgi:hypothetical protein
MQHCTKYFRETVILRCRNILIVKDDMILSWMACLRDVRMQFYECVSTNCNHFLPYKRQNWRENRKTILCRLCE